MATEFAGKLNARVRIERPGSVASALGGHGTWIGVVERWAEIRPLAGGAGGEGGAVRRRWRICLRAGVEVQAGWRLLWRGRDLRVTAVREDPAEAFAILLEADELQP